MPTRPLSTLPSTPQLLTIREAQTCLRVSRATIYNLVARGELRRVHLGKAVRIPLVEVEALIARGSE